MTDNNNRRVAIDGVGRPGVSVQLPSRLRQSRTTSGVEERARRDRATPTAERVREELARSPLPAPPSTQRSAPRLAPCSRRHRGGQLGSGPVQRSLRLGVRRLALSHLLRRCHSELHRSPPLLDVLAAHALRQRKSLLLDEIFTRANEVMRLKGEALGYSVTNEVVRAKKYRLGSLTTRGLLLVYVFMTFQVVMLGMSAWPWLSALRPTLTEVDRVATLLGLRN